MAAASTVVRPLTHYVEPIERGSSKGYCIICGFYTENGIPLKRLPTTFTDWYRVRHGSVVCPHCYTMLRDPRFRRKPWVMTADGPRFLASRKEAAKAIMEPPQPPFAIYVPLAGKKHGWIPLVHRGVNTSRDVITVGTEEYIVTFSRASFTELYEAVRELLARGARKTWLLAATPPPRLYAVAPRELLARLEPWIGTKLLHLAALLA